MQLGNVISSFRKKKKVDQKEFADALGVTVTYISLVENNKKKPSITLINNAAKYFGVPPSVLLFEAIKEKSKNSKEPEASKIAEALINRLVKYLITDNSELPKKPTSVKKVKIKKKTGRILL